MRQVSAKVAEALISGMWLCSRLDRCCTAPSFATTDAYCIHWDLSGHTARQLHLKQRSVLTPAWQRSTKLPAEQELASTVQSQKQPILSPLAQRQSQCSCSSSSSSRRERVA